MIRRLCLTTALLSACNPTTEAPPAPEAQGAPAAPQPPTEPEEAYVTTVTGLRRQPSDEKQVDDPQRPGKKLTNWATTLHRGELVQVVRVQGAWAEVRASDATAGWLKKDDLLPTEGVTMATVLAETKTFDRPDLLTLSPKRKLDPAALLYIVKLKEQFSEVNYGGAGTAWVLSETLATDKREVDAAKIVNKARWLEKKNDPTAVETMDLAKSQFGDTKVMLALFPAPPAAPAPEGATPPSPDGSAAPAPTAAPAPAAVPAVPKGPGENG